MLVDRPWFDRMKDEDFEFYERLLPAEDPLLDALEEIPWDSFLPIIASYYSSDRGQPAIDPLIMLKLEFLRYFRRLPDREVISRARTDVLYRYFLQIPVRYRLPAPTSLVNFRGRLGVDGFQEVFNQLISAARQPPERNSNVASFHRVRPLHVAVDQTGRHWANSSLDLAPRPATFVYSLVRSEEF